MMNTGQGCAAYSPRLGYVGGEWHPWRDLWPLGVNDLFAGLPWSLSWLRIEDKHVQETGVGSTE